MALRDTTLSCIQVFALTVAVWWGTGPTASAQTTLTIGDVRQRAASYNRQLLTAQQDLEQAKARVTTARAGVFPDVSLFAGYNRNFIIPSFFVTAGDETIEFKTGFKNNYASTLNVTQSIWEGGRVFTAWQIAKLFRSYSEDNLEAVEREIAYNADLLFYSAILQNSQLETLLRAHEATSYSLGMVEKQFQQGMVSEFELLRARVENANLEPAILQAESDVELARKRLKSFIGLQLRDSIVLVEDADDTSMAGLLSLDDLTDIALERRPEMQAARTLTKITDKAISIAKADYWPSLDASYTYSWSAAADRWDLNENQSKSSTLGFNFNWTVFEGGRRRGDVAYARADYQKTRIAEDQAVDDIRLEVEQAYDQLIRAKRSLEIQRETIAQAEEGLSIANLRFEQGVGTQLEVLSAQAALTQARNSLAQALFFFRTSKAELNRATTVDIDMEVR